jgi:CRISPR-associated endonuclease Cas2
MAPIVSTYVIAYDVASDERRLALSRVLEGVGHRVQYSVFEVLTTRVGLEAILARATAPSCFDPDENSLRCYRLCAECQEAAIVRGRGPGVVAAGRAVVI